MVRGKVSIGPSTVEDHPNQSVTGLFPGLIEGQLNSLLNVIDLNLVALLRKAPSIEEPTGSPDSKVIVSKLVP
jgi:hypothetical protein